MSLSRSATFLGLLAAAIAVLLAGSPPAVAAGCDRWASPTGSNVNSGTAGSPYRSVAHLIGQLDPGQTGCLTAGVFNEPPGTFIVNSTQGTQQQPVTVTSADPANPASIVGQLWLKEAADHVTFRDLQFTGSPGSDKSVMLLVGGADGVTFLDNNITFARGICLNVGVLTDRSHGFRLEGNRIHGCGTDVTLTGADSGVHGVYLLNSQDAVIHNNWIYDNKNRGIQHYPNADGTLITNNLLDGNGSNLNLSSEFSEGYLSEGIVARDNLITNSDLVALTNPNWPDADSAQVWGYGFGGTPRQPNQGNTHGNLVTENCIFQPNPAHNFGGWGYAQTNNTFADPQYKNRAGKDFTLLPTSPCAGKGPDPTVTPPPEPPDTTILKHPPSRTKLKTASFEFSSSEPEATFECRLNNGAWQSCTSPTSFDNLKPGGHHFSVRALNATGSDPTPATFVWRIDEVVPSKKCLKAKENLRLARKNEAFAKRKTRIARSKTKRREANRKHRQAKQRTTRLRKHVKASCRS